MAVKHILVVGGGSAGWIAASYLNAALNVNGRKTVRVSLVESPDIGRIGVGEATVPTIRHVLQTVGLDERSFMKQTDATFKQAIKFVNWRDNKGEGYYHPFDRRVAGAIDFAGRDWMMSDGSIAFAETVSVQPRLCEMGLGPRMKGTKDYASPLPYAYHMDAEKFADCLAQKAVTQGVEHYLDDVVDVEMVENGHIRAVKTKSGLRLEADIFIDCTGFAALLIEKTLGVGLKDFSKYLLCDRAIALQVPYDVHYPGFIRPYTQSTALSNGWAWDIALRNRRGTGYVYSSKFLDDDAAEEELRAFEGTHSKELTARRLRFPVGRREKFWVGNCISIGMSSGFIEPLESTALYLVEIAAVTLGEYFPYGDEMDMLADRFNRILSNRYEEILDFVNLHYCLTRRNDTPFWQAVQRAEHITDRLKEKLAFWAVKPPSGSDFDDQFRLFSHQSYEHVLYGMDALRDGDASGPAQIPEHISQVIEAAKSRLPRHEDWLNSELI